MATTDIVPFAIAPGANVQDQDDYAASGAVATGFTAGIAQSAPVNKALRQATFIASVVANFVIGQTDQDQPDDGNLTYAVNNLTDALTTLMATQNGHFKTFAGNPNGSVAGIAGVAGVSPPDICEDTTTGHLWVCTTTGNAGAAVWALGGSSGVTQVTAGAGLTGGNITSTGTIALGTATTSALGGVKIDGTSITISGGVISSTNAGGNVVGPGSGNATVGHYAIFENTSGTLLGDQGPASVAQIRAGTDNAAPATSAAIAGSQAWTTLADAATTSWDMSTGFNKKWTLGGNRTLGAPTNPIDGQTYALKLIQPSSGGPCTVTWPASFDWGTLGVPTLSTAANATDKVYLQYDSALGVFDASFKQG